MWVRNTSPPPEWKQLLNYSAHPILGTHWGSILSNKPTPVIYGLTNPVTICDTSSTAFTKCRLLFVKNKTPGMTSCVIRPLLSCFDCLLSDVLTTSKVISGRVPMCDSAHSKWLYSDAPQGWLLEFYVLTTPKVISGRVPTCDCALMATL